MNKLSKLLFEDYKKDNSDLRLELFVNSINSEFELNKKNKAQVRQLLADYISDSSKSREKLLENYISGTTTTKTVKSNKKEIKLLTIAKEDTNDYKLMKDLGTKINKLKSQNPSIQRNTEIEALSKELLDLETAAGYFADDPKAQEKTEISLLKGILGDWETAGTMAYEILNGGRPRLNITSIYEMPMLLKWLERYSGQQTRQFDIAHTVANNGFKNTWVLTEKGSGLPPVETSITQTVGQG